MGARLGRVLLVVALLVAQQAAFAHQAWHLAKATSGTAAALAAPEQQPPKSRVDLLCDFHSALSTVLGALSGATASSLSPVPLEVPFIAPVVPAFSIAAPVPASRDPPPFRP
jgi:hypothetical protein